MLKFSPLLLNLFLQKTRAQAIGTYQLTEIAKKQLDSAHQQIKERLDKFNLCDLQSVSSSPVTP